MSEVLDQEKEIREEIDDHIEENPISGLLVVGDVDMNLNKIEGLRKVYKCIHKDLKREVGDDYADEHEERLQKYISKIKQYILDGKAVRKEIRLCEVEVQNEDRRVRKEKEVDDRAQRVRATGFLIVEVQRLIKELLSEFNKTRDDVDDEEVMRRYEQLKPNLLKLERVSNKFQKTLEMIPESYTNKTKIVEDLTTKYNTLVKEKTLYEDYVLKEVQERELLKEKTFKASHLNIKLGRFGDYGSEKDIYTFQIEFEKLYLKSTPTKMLPDVLKNNHLDDPALTLVKNLDDINEIWKRLLKAYGDTKTLLNKKLAAIRTIGPLGKLKDIEGIKNGLSKVIYVMMDLKSLAKKHGIENSLYHSDAINIIYQLLGDYRVTKWLDSVCDDNLRATSEKEMWTMLISFLEKELSVQQRKSMIHQSLENLVVDKSTKGSLDTQSKYKVHTSRSDNLSTRCLFCGLEGHGVLELADKSLTEYFLCPTFVQMTPMQRFNELKRKGFCIQCLTPGMYWKQENHRLNCNDEFACKDVSHNKFPVKKHVLVCHEHKEHPDNKDLLKHYKQKCILSADGDIPEFSKNIKLSFLASPIQSKNDPSVAVTGTACCNDVIENGIFMLQTIVVDNEKFNLFFDSGCGDFVCRRSSTQRIGTKASLEFPGPISLGGVGGLHTESMHGIYQVRLPLSNGNEVKFSGVCLDEITRPFPLYPLNGQVSFDIQEGYKAVGGKVEDLPTLPDVVGSDTDFMIGVKYFRYYPEKVFQLPSGLAIYKSPFLNADGSDGVVGGPHAVFTEVEHFFRQDSARIMYTPPETYISNQYKLFKNGYRANLDIGMLRTIKGDCDRFSDNGRYHEGVRSKAHAARSEKMFSEVENAGTDISYRCVDCRNCHKCLNSEETELISIKEEIEQELIDKSVKVDVISKIAVARLPLIDNPVVKLAPNKKKAMSVYNSQVRKLNRNSQDKEDVIASEKKLQDLGYVEFVKNLDEADQRMLKEHIIQNFIPWRAVWNLNSISTRCRLVFDASQLTDSGYSLNNILAKGRNNMNRLVEVVLRWMIHVVAFHTDVQKMYNTIKLHKDDWCLQRYLWHNLLDVLEPPEEKVIMTVIYGVKSSGNQSEKALRDTAMLSKDEFPNIKKVVDNDIYVDDCLSGAPSLELAYKAADDLTLVVNRGGFNLKGITFSGKAPLEDLSPDGKSINVAGLKWFSESDEISLDINELNFEKKHRGKKPTSQCTVPEKLTRRHCVSKVAEVFDLTGKVTPIIASMKLDLQELTRRRLDWDDVIPNDLNSIWKSNFEMMQELGSIRFKRAIIPSDAVNLEIQTIDTGDASSLIACIAIYARFKRKDGTYSCQLIFARSKLISKETTQPRAELIAASVNAQAGFVVKRSFGRYHKQAVKLTDSQIVMHWIHNREKPLKQYVRNRVIEIGRLSRVEDWKYVTSSNMIADIGTRRGAKINDVGPGSKWIEGLDWMKLPISEFPVKEIDQIKLNEEEITTVKKEYPSLNNENFLDFDWTHHVESEPAYVSRKNVPDEVRERYCYSHYLLDPNKHRFKTVVRIMAIVRRYVMNLRRNVKRKLAADYSNVVTSDPPPSTETVGVILDDKEIREAANYYYRKATSEVKNFLNINSYGKISNEENGILYYTGRIFPTQEFNVITKMTDVMIDLTSQSFYVPVVDSHSPIAYSIVNEVHWYHDIAKHSGIETVLRYCMKFVYIVEGRKLVKLLRKNCERCKYLTKQTLSVSMGPISKCNLTIAPAFYITQVDMMGPLKAYSPHNKRNTIKIWYVVFCCATTSTVAIKVMEGYTTSDFIQAFLRFSCEAGYPKLLLPDEGSQLTSGCENMKLNFFDLKYQLHLKAAVEYETCPVGGHNMHGRVERKIKHVRESLEKHLLNERLSVLEWETLGSVIANAMNNMPLGLGSVVGDLENLDLITPNRLKLGRNNNRSPMGPLEVTGNVNDFLRTNKRIYETWFESWLTSYVPKLMKQPKWFQNDRDIKCGDVVLFLKQEKALCTEYQFGMIKNVECGKDDRIRVAIVKYRNHSENVDRETRRAVRQLVMIHPVDELDIHKELAEMAQRSNRLYLKNHKC